MITRESVNAFFQDIEAVCRKHGLSISHEDSHGGFIVEELKEYNIAWLRNAAVEGLPTDDDDDE